MKNKRAIVVFWLIMLGIVSFIAIDLLISSYTVLHTNKVAYVVLNIIPVFIFVLAIYKLIEPVQAVTLTETKLFTCTASFVGVRRQSLIRGLFGYFFPKIIITNARIKIGIVGLANIYPLHSLYFPNIDIAGSSLYSFRSKIIDIVYKPNCIYLSTSDGFIYTVHGSKNKLQQIHNILQNIFVK